MVYIHQEAFATVAKALNEEERQILHDLVTTLQDPLVTATAELLTVYEQTGNQYPEVRSALRNYISLVLGLENNEA